MQKLLHHSVTTIAMAVFLGSLFAMAIIASTTNPEEIGPFGLTAFFAILYIGSVGLIYLAWRGLNFVYERKQVRVRTLLQSAFIALGPVVLLALNTLKQLNFIDVLLVVAMVGLLTFYTSRR